MVSRTSRVVGVLLLTTLLAVCCCRAVPLPLPSENPSAAAKSAALLPSSNVTGNGTDGEVRPSIASHNVTTGQHSSRISNATADAVRTNETQKVDVRFFDPMEIINPIAGLLNGDFGIGLYSPKLPPFITTGDNSKPGDDNKNDLDPTLAVAAASSPLEPVIAPFRPFAMKFTGATLADLANLRPKHDLLFPFLDSPKNTLLAAATAQHLRRATAAGQDSAIPDDDHASKLTAEQLEQYKVAIEAWKQQNNFRSRSGALNADQPSPRFFGGFLSAGDLAPGYGFDDVVKPSGDLSSLLAASTVPINPYVSPFIPIASQLTGATPADYFNLKPTQDLVLPFLNPPLNSFLSALTGDSKLRAADSSRNQSIVTPQQVSTLVKSLAQQAKNLTQHTNTTNQGNATHLSARTFPLIPPFDLPSIDPVGAIAAVDLLHPSILNSFVLPFLPADTNPLLSLLYYLTPTLRAAGANSTNGKGSNETEVGRDSIPDLGNSLNFLDPNVLQAIAPASDIPKLPIRPLTDLVYPFLPADTNPLLSLLYYITPYPLKTQQRMFLADKAIATSLAQREGLSPVEAVQHAKRLQSIVAAAELDHTLKGLGLPGAGPLLRAFSPYLTPSTAGVTSRASILSALAPLLGDLFDSDKADGKKLGYIPGAAPILHYFYPTLPKKYLTPFKPLVSVRSGLFDTIGDLLDGPGSNDAKKLGHIPGSAPIVHYFHPYTDKKVLKPFKPVAKLREAANNFANQRLFELKYMAAARAAMKARYQQRLMKKIGLRHGRQFFNTFLDDLSKPAANDEEAQQPEYDDVNVNNEQESNPDDVAAEEELRDETAADEEDSISQQEDDTTTSSRNSSISTEDQFIDETVDFFASENSAASSPLANLFRFFVPDLTSLSDEETAAALGDEDTVEGSTRSARSLFNSEELSGTPSYDDAASFIVDEVERHAPFPVNHIWHWWTEKRLKRSADRQGRSLTVNRGNFKEQLEALKQKQTRSLSLNDTFVGQVSAHRESRSLLGGLVGSFLPFPFNLFASFMIPFRQNQQSATNTDDGEETANDDDGTSEETEYQEGFEDAGISAEEGDLRMAAMVKPFLPAPVEALLGAIMPFRSFEDDLKVEAAADETEDPDEAADAAQHFQQALADVKRQYDAQAVEHQKNVDGANSASKVEQKW